nr:MAG TPA: Prex DNA polymerase [Caudoviricetes sp.]
MGCTLEEAEEFAKSYAEGFPGIAAYKKKASQEVRNKGYIVLCKFTGHKTYWAGYENWKKVQASYTSEFWEEYRNVHKPKKDKVYFEVKEHFQEVSKFDRKSLNSPTQGTGAIILKDSQIDIFWWVVDNGYFGKCLLANLTHDECNWEYPENLKIFPSIIKSKMEESAAKYCKALPIPADVAVGDHWIH